MPAPILHMGATVMCAHGGQAMPTVSSVGSVLAPYPDTQIQLQSPLANCYDRAVTTVNANVGLATQGQSVSEILGSGNGSTPNQSFTLKQNPLTYVQAPTATGRQSTLEIKVNGMTWNEASSLYDQSPSRLAFSTLNQANGTTEVLFGDGVEGALLPTEQTMLWPTTASDWERRAMSAQTA